MKNLTLLIPLLLLAGCATPAPQQVIIPRGYYGQVIEQKWLTDDTLHLVYETAPGVNHRHGSPMGELHTAEAGLAKGWPPT